jgi:hypothetical protein
MPVKLVIGLALAVAIIGISVRVAAPTVPSQFIKGRPASYWVGVLGQNSNTPPVVFDSLARGPEAIPFLARCLEQRNGLIKEIYLKLFPHLPAALQSRLGRPIDARFVKKSAAHGLFSWIADRALANPWEDVDVSAVPYLIGALRDEDAEVRRSVAAALSGAGVAHPEVRMGVVSALIERLERDPSPLVRENAACTLKFQGEAAQAAVPALARALNDTNNNSDVQFFSASVLKDINPDAAKKAGADAAILQWYLDMLRSPDTTHRMVGAMGLGELGKVALIAVPLLREASNDRDQEVRKLAGVALEAIAKAP